MSSVAFVLAPRRAHLNRNYSNLVLESPKMSKETIYGDLQRYKPEGLSTEHPHLRNYSRL